MAAQGWRARWFQPPLATPPQPTLYRRTGKPPTTLCGAPFAFAADAPPSRKLLSVASAPCSRERRPGCLAMLMQCHIKNTTAAPNVPTSAMVKAKVRAMCVAPAPCTVRGCGVRASQDVRVARRGCMQDFVPAARLHTRQVTESHAFIRGISGTHWKGRNPR